MNLNERRAKNTRSKILASAKKLIGKRGYDNVSVNQIIADCGVAKGTFYHHFKSKDELLGALCESTYETLSEFPPELSASPFLERMQWFVSNFNSHMEKFNLHFARHALKLYVENSQPDSMSFTISQLDEGIVLVRNMISLAVESGELKPDTPVDFLAKTVMFCLQGSTIYHCNHGKDFDVMAWNDKLLPTVIEPLFANWLN